MGRNFENAQTPSDYQDRFCMTGRLGQTTSIEANAMARSIRKFRTQVFDVTQAGEEFYGDTKAYAPLTGRDASRASHGERWLCGLQQCVRQFATFGSVEWSAIR